MTSAAVELSSQLMNTVTSDFISVVSSSNPQVTRPPGLLATAEDLKALKRFYRFANELPQQLDQIKQLLGYDASGIVGLEPADIQTLYRSIRDTADQWPNLEINMKTVSSKLVVFADDLKSVGEDVIHYVKSLDSYGSAEGTVGDTTEVSLDAVPHLPMLASDAGKVTTLHSFIKELTDLVDDQKREVTKVKSKIVDYKYDLTALAAEVGLKRRLCLSAAQNKDSTELNLQIDSLNTQIEEQQRTHGTYSRYKWVGAWWGPLGLAVSASIYGIKAAEVWEEVERLIAEKDELSKQVRSNEVTQALLKFESDLQDMSLRIDGAIGGAANLEELWDLIHTYITSSIDRFRKTNNATLLTIFVSRLTNLISNWQHVKEKSRLLLTTIESPERHP